MSTIHWWSQSMRPRENIPHMDSPTYVWRQTHTRDIYRIEYKCLENNVVSLWLDYRRNTCGHCDRSARCLTYVIEPKTAKQSRAERNKQHKKKHGKSPLQCGILELNVAFVAVVVVVVFFSRYSVVRYRSIIAVAIGESRLRNPRSTYMFI